MARATAVKMSLTGMDIDTEPPGPPAEAQSHVLVPVRCVDDPCDST